MLQTRWTTGQGGSCVACARSVKVVLHPSVPPVTTPGPSPLQRLGSRCTPAYHVEHSPESRWIAVSLNRRTSSSLSQVRPAIKTILPRRSVPSRPYMRPALRWSRTDAGSHVSFCTNVPGFTTPPQRTFFLAERSETSPFDWRCRPLARPA